MTHTESDPAVHGRILLIGDLLIDKTYYVKPLKISAEAPILVVSTLSLDYVEKAGGAGLAASFAAKYIKDTNVIFYTAISKEKKEWMKNNGVNVESYNIPDANIITKSLSILIIW